MKRKESNRKLKAKQTGNTTSRYKKQKKKKGFKLTRRKDLNCEK